MESVAAWLGNLSQGKSRDTAVEAFASAVTQLDPNAAAAWAQTIAADDVRNRVFSNIFQSWSYYDAEAAKQWLQGVNVPDEMKETFIKAAEARSGMGRSFTRRL
jgi:hypothetical protein